MVHVRGKRGRQVPVLMSVIEEEAIKVIKDTRQVISTADGNPFVFACPNRASKNSLRGNEAMLKVLNCIKDLKNPERIRSTELRKYCATVTQIADLTEGDLQWLADHLGHDLNVHREFYRLRESTVELTKVARLLLAVDEGKAHNFAGKSISDIDIEGEHYNLLLLNLHFHLQTGFRPFNRIWP